MGRRKTKPLSAAIAQARRVRQRERLRFGMVYCSNKKCGWGWELREGLKCSQCGSLPEGEGEEVVYCENPECKFSWLGADGLLACPRCGTVRREKPNKPEAALTTESADPAPPKG
ncbi:MAG: hypothetical protein V1820_01505 [archaeon]